MEHGLKAGIYKIASPVDASVLTATTEGHPRAVNTGTWESLDTQKWKVKVRTEDESSIQVIRNEAVKNNEVSKATMEGGEDEDAELGPVDWKFTPALSDNGNVFLLNNGVGFLTNNGSGERISFAELKESDPSQQWEFEFLSDIEKPIN